MGLEAGRKPAVSEGRALQAGGAPSHSCRCRLEELRAVILTHEDLPLMLSRKPILHASLTHTGVNMLCLKRESFGKQPWIDLLVSVLGSELGPDWLLIPLFPRSSGVGQAGQQVTRQSTWGFLLLLRSPLPESPQHLLSVLLSAALDCRALFLLWKMLRT